MDESKQKEQQYKKEIVEKTIKEVFEDVTYDFEKGIEFEQIQQSNMIVYKYAFPFYSGDYVRGKYKNVEFEMSDIYIEYKKSDDYETLFNGQWYIFDFNKNFQKDVQMYDSDFNEGGFFNPVWPRKYVKCKLEDVAFNKRFKVFAEKEMDAFYILTPPMMERITKLSDEIEGTMILRFTQNKLHIGINNGKDIFEMDDDTSEINVDKEVEKIKSQLKPIVEFIEILNLSDDLFGGEI